MIWAVASGLLPDLTVEEQFRLVQETGYDALELSLADPVPGDGRPPFAVGGSRREPVGPANLAAHVNRIAAASRSLALPVCALGSAVDLLSPAAFGPLAAAAADLGAPIVGVRAPAWDGRTPYEELFAAAVEGLGQLETAAAQHGVRAAVEARPETIAPSASALRRLLEGFDPAHVGALLDPGGLAAEGFEAWDLGLQVLGPSLAHVRASNAVWVLRDKPAGGPFGWRPRPARLREGVVNWREALAALAAARYEGALALADVTDQPARLKLEDALDFLRQATA